MCRSSFGTLLGRTLYKVRAITLKFMVSIFDIPAALGGTSEPIFSAGKGPVGRIFCRLHHTFESKESQGKDAGGDQGDGCILKRLGNPGQEYTFAYTGKEDQCQTKTDGIA